MLHRFSRTELIIGSEGLRKIGESCVAIFGLGGVGGAAAEALARSGVGKLILIDHDVVDITNLNRQLIALESTIGRPKVEIMAERISQINPHCVVRQYQEFFSREREDLLSSEYDYVVDAIDSVGAKVDLIEGCYRRQIPLISAMGAGNKLDPTQFQVVDISATHTCPLARVVRLELRKRGINQGVKTVFSTERPLPVNQAIQELMADNKGGRRRVPGSSAVVPPVAGYIMASVVVRDILGL